jgi:hypothetical protein
VLWASSIAMSSSVLLAYALCVLVAAARKSANLSLRQICMAKRKSMTSSNLVPEWHMPCSIRVLEVGSATSSYAFDESIAIAKSPAGCAFAANSYVRITNRGSFRIPQRNDVCRRRQASSSNPALCHAALQLTSSSSRNMSAGSPSDTHLYDNP